MKNLFLLTTLFIVTYLSAQKADTIFEINPYTHVVLNEANDAFKVVFEKDGRTVSSKWEKEELFSHSHHFYKHTMPISFFELGNHYIDDLTFTNIIPFDEQHKDLLNSAIKTHIPDIYSCYFAIVLSQSQLFIYKSSIINQIDITTHAQTTWDRKDYHHFSKDLIYTLSYEDNEEYADQTSNLKVFNGSTGTTMTYTNDSLLYKELKANPYSRDEYLASVSNFLGVSPPSSTKVIITQEPQNTFVYDFKDNPKLRKKTLKKNTLLYEDAGNVILITKEGKLFIYDTVNPRPVRLYNNKYFDNSSVSINVQNNLIGITKMNTSVTKRELVLYKLIDSNQLLFQASTGNSTLTPLVTLPINSIERHTLVNNHILIFQENNFVTISEDGKKSKIKKTETNLLFKTLFDADFFHEFNTSKRSTTKVSDYMKPYLPSYNEASNYYFVGNNSSKWLVNSHFNNFDEFLELPSDVTEVIPFSEFLSIVIKKDGSWNLIKMENIDELPDELQTTQYYQDSTITGWYAHEYGNYFIDLQEIKNVSEPFGFKEINEALARISVGVVSLNDSIVIIKSHFPEKVDVSAMIDKEGMPAYDDYGNPIFEHVLNVGSNNSGIYNKISHKWMFPPSAKDIFVNDKGFTALFPSYQDDAYVKYYPVGYDWQANKLWELNNDDSLKYKLIKKVAENNEQTVLASFYDDFLTSNKNGKQSVLRWNKQVEYPGIKITNKDVILNLDPMIYMNNDSIYSYQRVYNNPNNPDSFEEGSVFICMRQYQNIFFKQLIEFQDDYEVYVQDKGIRTVLDTLQLRLGFDTETAWILDNKNIVSYGRPTKPSTAIDDESGFPMYDDMGNPMFVNDMNFVLINQIQNETYNLKTTGYNPVYSTSFFGYIPIDQMDNQYGKTRYLFLDHSDEPYSKLNEYDFFDVVSFDSENLFIGKTSKKVSNNSVLFDAHANILFEDYNSFYFDKGGNLHGFKYDKNYKESDTILELK
jgi:hypothetical protein